jgi:hypothetical protein
MIDEYGNSVKYTLISKGSIKYEPANDVESGTAGFGVFTYYNDECKSWKDSAINESVTLKCTRYHYYPTTLTDKNDRTVAVGIGVNAPEYKMLFTNSSTGADKKNSGSTANFIYWLGSTYCCTYGGFIENGIFNIYTGDVRYQRLCDSVNYRGCICSALRPIVTIDSKVGLKDCGTQKDGCKLYNLVIK